MDISSLEKILYNELIASKSTDSAFRPMPTSPYH
jgi:hypothetical protein